MTTKLARVKLLSYCKYVHGHCFTTSIIMHDRSLSKPHAIYSHAMNYHDVMHGNLNLYCTCRALQIWSWVSIRQVPYSWCL